MECTKCKASAEGWPDRDGGELCQNCWERECDAEWWEFITEISLAVHAAVE